ncbi:MAG TPA: hypothetical protein VF681_00155 [Abditibacteriaceae bacterium]|jgi:hypothetical protein
MPHATLINSTDLHLWASRKAAQSKLPQLLRRLVRATVPNIKKSVFPADEGVQLGGYDGIVEVETGNDLVPDGTSVWELGASLDVKGKADDDYKKRTDAPSGIDPSKSTFVFVTPRRWGGKEAWIEEKLREEKWLDVRAYDAHDIEAFLEIAPAVHIWASILLGKRPEGAIDLDNYWQEWVTITYPHTSYSLVIAGRHEAENAVMEWLKRDPACLSLQAETQDEAVAFLAACTQHLPENLKVDVIERCIVVEHEVEWRRLSLCPEPLILIPTFGDRSLVAAAVSKGHHVFLPLGLSEAATTANVAVKRPHRDAVCQSLEEMGVPQHQIDDLATLGRRSLSALRRRLAINSSLLIPDWADAAKARVLLPALLVGQWDDSHEGDRKVIARLAGCEYSQVQEVLLRWSNTANPFIRRVGDVWLVISKEDSWTLLSRFLTGDDLHRLEEAVLEVLGEVDPKYELPIKNRIMASFLGKQLSQSNRLRAGLAETLTILAARSDVAALADTNTGQDWANRILYKLFATVNTWEQWASLDAIVVSLAEASPNSFLDAVECLVSGDEPVAVSLFHQEDNLWSSPEHTGLLWALELLAWSPDYLGRVATLLAQLTRLDPGGKWANRPKESLETIFLVLHPCTKATQQQRLKAIDLIRKHESNVAWNLMVRIVPQSHTSVHPTHRPDFRDWGTDEYGWVTWKEAHDFVKELTTRLCEDVGINENRWKSLIPLVDELPDEQFDVVVGKMGEMSAALALDENRVLFKISFRDSLRELLSRHISYPDAEWSMSQERIEKLRHIYTILEPEDLVTRDAWQFSHQAQFMIADSENWEEKIRQIEGIRQGTLRKIYEADGLAAVFRLAQKCQDPHLVGWTFGRLFSLGEQEDDFLARTLESTESHHVILGQGYVKARLASDVSWLPSKLDSSFVLQGTPLQKVNFYLSVSSERNIWDLVKAAGAEAEHLYWSRVGLWTHGALSKSDLQFFIEYLVQHDRMTEALHYISAQSHSAEGPLAPEFIMSLLERAISSDIPQQVDWSQLGQDVPRLLKIIEESKEIDDNRLGVVEFLFLSLFEHSVYQPKALTRGLSADPAFFCDLIKRAFKAKDEESRELSEEEQTWNLQAYRLLRQWRTLPGSDEEGNVNADELLAWTAKARELVNDCGRGIIGEQEIGQMLSHSPKGGDGLWPHEAVRRVIEEIASKQLEKGFQVGAFNNRGITSRGLTDGGDQERDIATRYRDHATKFRDEWPRTSRMLDGMAERYEQDSRGRDIDADLTQDFWR